MVFGSLRDSKMRDWVIFAAVCLTSAALLVSEAHASGVNYRGPFEGRVVDQDTGQPIEGAVVFVRWDLQRITSPVFFDAKEVLTDKEGRFYIPAEWSWLPWRNFFLYSEMIIFKAGYGCVQLPGGPPDSDLETAKRFERITPEQRKSMGPCLYFNIGFEEGTAVFRLKKLETTGERWKNLSRLILPQPEEYSPMLLRREIAAEEKAIRRSQRENLSK
jgi:hypothetical protein